MEHIVAQKGADLLKEIKDISRYKDILANKSHGKIAHIELVQHYGKIDSSCPSVVFDHKYTHLFIPVIDGIINNLKAELESL